MNTRKIAELLAEIEQAQDTIRTLEKEAAGVAKKIAMQHERIAELKQSLALELRDVVPPIVAKPASAKRQRGLSSAVLEALADGVPHTTADVAAKLATAGLDAAHVSVTLSTLAKNG